MAERKCKRREHAPIAQHGVGFSLFQTSVLAELVRQVLEADGEHVSRPTSVLIRRPSARELDDEPTERARVELEATGELMRYLSAMDTAADVEQIRQALSPNDGLAAYGASHGSQYGQAYLEHYGEHIKALVLDGVVDHSIDLPTFITRNTLAVQDAFERFGQWCNRDGA